MEKITIYTCITDGYDVLQQHYPVPDGFDLICFVPHGCKKSEAECGWKIKELPELELDAHMLSRFPKLLPHKVLPDGWSLWIDGNIRILDGELYDICRRLQEKGGAYAGIAHPFSDCAYAEALTCIKDRRDSLERLSKAVKFLRSKSYPEHAGLMENNIILRLHSNETIRKFDEMWWDCLQKYSRRDQILHGWCLRECGIKPELILPAGTSVRDFDGVEYLLHPKNHHGWIYKALKYIPGNIEGLILKIIGKI